MQFGYLPFYDRNAADARLISTVVAMSLYPNVAYRKRKRWWSPVSSATVGLHLLSLR